MEDAGSISKTSTGKLNTQGAAELPSVENFKTKHLPGRDQRNLIICYCIRLNGLWRYCPGLHFEEVEITPTINLGYLVSRTQLHFNPDNPYLKLNTQQCILIFDLQACTTASLKTSTSHM